MVTCVVWTESAPAESQAISGPSIALRRPPHTRLPCDEKDTRGLSPLGEQFDSVPHEPGGT